MDARGLACPLPLTMARRRMAELEPGALLVVLATDPEAPIDLGALAAEHGLEFAVAGEEIRLRRPCRRAADRPRP